MGRPSTIHPAAAGTPRAATTPENAGGARAHPRTPRRPCLPGDVRGQRDLRAGDGPDESLALMASAARSSSMHWTSESSPTFTPCQTAAKSASFATSWLGDGRERRGSREVVGGGGSLRLRLASGRVAPDEGEPPEIEERFPPRAARGPGQSRGTGGGSGTFPPILRFKEQLWSLRRRHTILPGPLVGHPAGSKGTSSGDDGHHQLRRRRPSPRRSAAQRQLARPVRGATWSPTGTRSRSRRPRFRRTRCSSRG